MPLKSFYRYSLPDTSGTPPDACQWILYSWILDLRSADLMQVTVSESTDALKNPRTGVAAT